MTPAVKILNKARIRLLADAEEAALDGSSCREQAEAHEKEARRLSRDAAAIANDIRQLGGELADNLNDTRLAPERGD